MLGAEERAWLETLSPSAVRDGVELFHASPRDPIWEYVLSDHIAQLGLEATAAPLVLVGHSHVPLAIAWDETTLTGGVAMAGHELALAGARRLLNPGSVGQPRDGNPNAAWLWLDFAGGQRRSGARRTTSPALRPSSPRPACLRRWLCASGRGSSCRCSARLRRRCRS